MVVDQARLTMLSHDLNRLSRIKAWSQRTKLLLMIKDW